MPEQRHTSDVDLYLLLCDARGQIVLGQQADGRYQLPGRPLAPGEAATRGAVRALAGQTGNHADPKEPRLVHALHHHDNSQGRLALVFEITRHHWEPAQPHPDTGTSWEHFSDSKLPGNIALFMKAALKHTPQGRLYSEHGREPIAETQ
ncbi:hypothetical protein ACFWXK_10485 [Streptomyces sp. NPDC059070]|uniref:hypothetical protein n=1 Tax=Streptomyces sp. NPDC059070 TaxID=3346713 RepID=UPI00368E7D10